MQIEIFELISKHQLLPHPEGGHYKETYRSESSTGIFYLLTKGDFSSLHKIASDEMWHFYGGDSLVVLEIDENLNVIETLIDSKNPQYVVAANRWFGAYLPGGSRWAFCGCTVSPPFSFESFKLANLNDLETMPKDVVQRVSGIVRS